MSEQEPPLRDRSKAARAARPVGIARHGRLPRRTAWKTVVGLIAGALAVVLVSTVSVVSVAAYQLASAIGPGVVINETEAPIPEIGAYEGGFNVLIVGSDEYYDRTSVLNDVNILVHVSADQTSAVAVSFPRDMVVPFPSCTNEKTGRKTSAATGLPINNALSYGGLSCVVSVVENFTGLDIQFAGMIGFEGVAEMATAVGGVYVCVSGSINDKYVGLNLEEGVHHLEGWEALQFVRSRHGVGDGSDLTRISSQQVFLSALVRKLKAEDTLTNVGKLLSLAQAAVQNMTLSQELSQPLTMVAMAKALSRISMDRITFVQYPGTTGGTGIYSGKVQPNKVLGAKLIDAILADQAVALTSAGDGRGSELDPNATTEPTETTEPTPSDSETATSTPTAEETLSEAVTIDGLRGQTAADQTCTVGN